MRLADGQSGPKIGLIWAGRQEHGSDYARSLPLEKLAKLVKRHDFAFYSLQKEGELPPEFSGKITALGPELADFSHTAACLSVLDLLISVDTAPVHLAGALGTPCWVMLATPPDWRWLEQGDTSPWYPGLRLFRQRERRDWDSVIGAVDYALDLFRDQRSGIRDQNSDFD